jgi:WD40 repeat protein
VASGREVFEHRLTAPNPTTRAGFDPAGRLLVGDHNAVRALDLGTGRSVRTYRGPAGHVHLFAVGGGKVAAVEWLRQPYVWDAAADPERTAFRDRPSPRWAVLRPATGELVTLATDRTANLRDPTTGRLVRALTDHPGDTTALAVSPDGGLLAVGCKGGAVRVWDPDTDRPVGEWRWPADAVTALAFSPDGRLLASGGTDRAVRVWDPRTGVVRREWPDTPHWPVTLTFSPDGRRLVSACGHADFEPVRGPDRGAVQVFDVETGTTLSTVRNPDLVSMALEFAPGGSRLYTVSGLRPTIDVWDPATGTRLRTLTGYGVAAFRLAFTPDGARYATAEPGRLRVWDTASDQECLSLRLPNPFDVPAVLAFSADGRRLAVGCESGTFHVFDAPPPPGDPPPVRTPAAAPIIHGGIVPVGPH